MTSLSRDHSLKRVLASTAFDLELRLAALFGSASGKALFWAPHGWREPSDWIQVRSAEHLAVRISTACRSDNNVCFASSSRGTAERTATVIGLVGRDHLGWAVIIKSNHSPSWAGHIHHAGYLEDHYESFSALTAAEITQSWVTEGRLPEALTFKLRRY